MIDFRRSLPCDSAVGRLLRFPLKLIPSNVAVPILSGPLKGLKWLAGAGNHGCWLGTYELSIQQRIAQDARSDDVAFDLGANHGFFTMLLARHSKLVIAVEPFAPNISILQRHLAMNGIENCEVLRAAVGRDNGTAFFARGPNHATGRISASGAIEVDIVSLEELVKRFGPASIIKMDIEGAELGALTGGASYLKERRPKLFISTHGRDIHEECVKLLRSLGFALQIDEFDLFAW